MKVVTPLDPEKFEAQRRASLLVAQEVKKQAIALLESKKAPQHYIKRVASSGDELITRIFEDDEFVMVLSYQSIPQYVEFILEGWVKATEEELGALREGVPGIICKLLELVMFYQLWRFRKFKSIVRNL